MPKKHKRSKIPPTRNTIDRSDLAGVGKHVQKVLNVPSNCSFSLKYLKADDKFVVEHSDPVYYHKVIQRLQALSSTSVSDLMANRSKALRCHPIDWDDKRVSRNCFGIPREEELCDKPYQVNVSRDKYGRLHGFFTGDIFNIVWFDKDHALYRKRK